MSKGAKEAVLGELHVKIAKVMGKALDTIDKAQATYLEAEDTTELLFPEVSPPLLGVITKFLADNKITCAPDESAELSELEQKLATKRAGRRQRVGNVVQMIQEDD